MMTEEQRQSLRQIIVTKERLLIPRELKWVDIQSIIDATPEELKDFIAVNLVDKYSEIAGRISPAIDQYASAIAEAKADSILASWDDAQLTELYRWLS